jgi:hypothetical protein
VRNFKTSKRIHDACHMASVSRMLSGQGVVELGHCLAGLY